MDSNGDADGDAADAGAHADVAADVLWCRGKIRKRRFREEALQEKDRERKRER